MSRSAEGIALRGAVRYALAVAISGACVALSLPPYGVWWLAYVAFAPLLYLSDRYTPLISYGTGMLAVGIAGRALAGHIANSAQTANLIAGMGSLSQAVGLALCLVGLARNLPTPVWIVFAACAGVVGEWVISHLLAVSIAISQHANPYALSLSSVTGIWGVTFAIWYVSACIAATLMRKGNVTKPALAIPVLILLVVSRVHLMPLDQTGDKVKVAAVQAPDAFMLSEETAKLRGSVKIAVWSECSLDPDDREVFDVARSNHMYIAANFVEPRKGMKPLNTSCYIDPDGRIIGRCRKQHLFGKEIFHFGRPGEGCRAITDESGLKLGLPTCYDTMFTDTVRGYVRDGARLILVPNSDPEAPNHIFAMMHAGMTAFRAAENAVPIALADTMSISTIFDSGGRVVAESEHGVPCSVAAEVSLGTGRTIFNRIGDLLVYVCMAFVIIAPAYVRRRRAVLQTRAPSQESPPEMPSPPTGSPP